MMSHSLLSHVGWGRALVSLDGELGIMTLQANNNNRDRPELHTHNTTPTPPQFPPWPANPPTACRSLDETLAKSLITLVQFLSVPYPRNVMQSTVYFGYAVTLFGPETIIVFYALALALALLFLGLFSVCSCSLQMLATIYFAQLRFWSFSEVLSHKVFLGGGQFYGWRFATQPVTGMLRQSPSMLHFPFALICSTEKLYPPPPPFLGHRHEFYTPRPSCIRPPLLEGYKIWPYIAEFQFASICCLVAVNLR